ncbi:MAG: hypothetical protein IJ786_02490 [Bacteroidaceae bacterium]|nr:hypothetical protein [Bacteroidaceae bacterium]
MKHLFSLLLALLLLNLSSCGKSTPQSEADIDSTQYFEDSSAETQRFLDQEGDIISDEEADTVPVNADATDDEDTEGNLPPITEQ